MGPDGNLGETPRAKVKRRGRFPLGAAFALLAGAAAPAGAGGADILELNGVPLALSAGRLEAARIGALTWLGGLELSSPDPRFGGLSALLVSPDGARATVVSDRGHWLDLALRHGAEGRLTGVAAGRMGPLRDPGGARLRQRWDKDAESLARLPDGSLAVAFERSHRLWRYAGGLDMLAGVPVPLVPPPGLDRLEPNGGIEALSELGGGDLLAIAEGDKHARESPAFLWRGGRWHRLTYARDGGFRPTGAALLPDGDVLVIERFFTVSQGVRIRLVRVPGAAVRADARLSGEVIATLAPPMALDNMEGVATRRGPNGETLIYLISDDNFNPLQRTLLMLFALRG